MKINISISELTFLAKVMSMRQSFFNEKDFYFLLNKLRNYNFKNKNNDNKIINVIFSKKELKILHVCILEEMKIVSSCYKTCLVNNMENAKDCYYHVFILIDFLFMINDFITKKGD